MKPLIPLLAACLALAICAPAQAACFGRRLHPRHRHRSPGRLRLRPGHIQTTLPSIDTNPFAAGRYAYLALYPAHPMYKPFLTLAATALQTGRRIYANVQSGTSVVPTLPIVTEASNL